MSIQAMHYVFQGSLAEMGSRLVLISLANHANDSWLSWPAVKTISHETRMDQRSVQRALRKLERDGEIEPHGAYSRGGRRATTYFLVRCMDWYGPVGATTGETPYGNRGQTVGLTHENAANDAENTPIPRHSAGGAPALTTPHPRHSAGVAPAQRRPSPGTAPGYFARFVTPAPALTTQYPGTAPPEPKGTIIEPSNPKSYPRRENRPPIYHRGRVGEEEQRRRIASRDARVDRERGVQREVTVGAGPSSCDQMPARPGSALDLARRRYANERGNYSAHGLSVGRKDTRE